MNIPSWVWIATIAVLAVALAVDVFVIGRRPHEPTLRESTLAVVFFVSMAVVFGLGVLVFSGSQYAGEFYAGWLTEYALSVDNLFIFIIIMSRFAVPRELQQTVLLIGIILALVFRGIFIALGAAAINNFSWVFYLFGAFLVYTAIGLFRQGEMDEGDYKENRLITWTKRAVPMVDHFEGTKVTVRQAGKRLFTPMLVVMIAIGSTDILFALDSIPAIYGLTSEPYLVFTANVFALMGLRQLYFLLGGLLQRLIYLTYGLSLILAFIGVKLVLEALHLNELGFINGGDPVPWAPEIPIWLSLTVIIGTLVLTAVLSLWKTARDERATTTPT
ncbi:MAG: TerC family protein [Actinomycetota bacterium]|nr:TerC family protein [Actinomycetota bacterium]